MRKLSTIATALAITAAFAIPASAAKPWSGPGLDSGIVETAVSLSGGGALDANPNDFDILITALVATGAVNLFDGSDDYTVFAPIDQAFLDLTGEATEAAAVNWLVANLGVSGIANVLQYHVTDGSRPSPSVLNAKKIKMLNGSYISGKSMGGTLKANNSYANIIQANVKVSDGMIHVIDSVLLP